MSYSLQYDLSNSIYEQSLYNYLTFVNLFLKRKINVDQQSTLDWFILFYFLEALNFS